MPHRPQVYLRLLARMRRVLRNDHLILPLFSILIGLVTGHAIIIFRESITLIQGVGFGSSDERLYLFVQTLPGWVIVLVPTLGGLLVGLYLKFIMPGGQPQGIANVIEASALRGGWMSSRTGLHSAIVSALSIGSGASVGREGPAVHLGASLGAWCARRLHLSRSLSRTLLGCGVSAAVAASFNAPIAGALFASEVVIGHYALRAFAPIVISSVAATAASQAYFGDFPAFEITTNFIASYWEFPAFIGLGIVSGIVALILIHSADVIKKLTDSSPLPIYLKPVIAGLLVGLIALMFPQILGVGYGVTEAALLAKFSLWTLVGIGIAKILATAISLGGGFGGGIFSPALVIGAMTGGAFGIIATQVFPELSSGSEAYTLIGMGAVAAAVLGAPISTTLIIFELTRDFTLTLAVITAVIIASELVRASHKRSFFHMQLKNRGIDLRSGFEAGILRKILVGSIMAKDHAPVLCNLGLQKLRARLQKSRLGELFVINDLGALKGTITLADLSETAFDHGFDDLVNALDVARLHPPFLTKSCHLEQAIKIMDEYHEDHIAIVDNAQNMKYIGCLHHHDAMNAYNRALLESRHEEHGD